MRVQNTKVKFTIPIPVDKPDCNGVVYTKEAIEKAVNNLNANLPIVYKEDVCDDEMVIGVTTDNPPTVTFNSDNQVCHMTVDGILFYSGAEIFVNEIEDGNVSDFRIASIGLTTYK